MTDQPEINIGDTVVSSDEGIDDFGTGEFQLGHNMGVVLDKNVWNEGWWRVQWYHTTKNTPITNVYKPRHLKHAVVSLDDLL